METGDQLASNWNNMIHKPPLDEWGTTITKYMSMYFYLVDTIVYVSCQAVSLSGSQECVRVFQIFLQTSHSSFPFEHFFFKSVAFPSFFFSSSSFFFAWQKCLVIFPVFKNCFLGKGCLHWESSESGHLKTLLQVESSKELPDRSVMTVLWESSFVRVSTPF